MAPIPHWHSIDSTVCSDVINASAATALRLCKKWTPPTYLIPRQISSSGV